MIVSSVVLTAALFGAGGGLLRHLIVNHGIVLPRWNKTERKMEAVTDQIRQMTGLYHKLPE